MVDVPTSVTYDQLRAACEALGLPATDISRLELDARCGVTVHLRGRDEQGRILADRHGEPVVAVLEIPIAPLRAEDAAGLAPLLPDAEAVDALKEYFEFATWAGVSRDEAERILHRSGPPGARLTAAVVTKAGDRLAELSGRRDGARSRIA